MKKFLTAMTTVLTVIVLSLTLAACSNKAGSIKNAFKNESFYVTEQRPEDCGLLLRCLTNEQKEDLSDYEVFTCTRYEGPLQVQEALVVKFPSRDEIIKTFGQESYDSMVKSGTINGNCVLFSSSGSDVKRIFKRA